MKQVFAAAFAAAILHPTTASVAADAQRGEELYGNRCSGCHSVEMNRIGPKHRGVVGREAGSVADYDYSEALRESSVVWDEASLDAWADESRRISFPARRCSSASEGPMNGRTSSPTLNRSRNSRSMTPSGHSSPKTAHQVWTSRGPWL